PGEKMAHAASPVRRRLERIRSMPRIVRKPNMTLWRLGIDSVDDVARFYINSLRGDFALLSLDGHRHGFVSRRIAHGNLLCLSAGYLHQCPNRPLSAAGAGQFVDIPTFASARCARRAASSKSCCLTCMTG